MMRERNFERKKFFSEMMMFMRGRVLLFAGFFFAVSLLQRTRKRRRGVGVSRSATRVREGRETFAGTEP